MGFFKKIDSEIVGFTLPYLHALKFTPSWSAHLKALRWTAYSLSVLISFLWPQKNSKCCLIFGQLKLERVNLSLMCFYHTPTCVGRECCSAGIGQPRLLESSPVFARKLLLGWGSDLTSHSFQFIKFALNAHFMHSKPPMVLGDQISNVSYKMLL